MLNVGTPDRIIRIILGAILVALPFFGLALFANPLLGWGSIIVGMVLIATAAIGYCPLYGIFGLRTRPRS